MNYHQRNNFKNHNKRSGGKIFFLVFGLFIVFVFLFSFNTTRGLFFILGKPLWVVKNSIDSFFIKNINVLKSKSSLIEENILLKEEIKKNSNSIVLFDLIKKENEDLKGILDRKNTNLNILLSAVLIKPTFSSYDTLIIDAGFGDGVSVNDKVLAEGNIFIGYVSEVYQNTSKVVLYSSPGEKIAVFIGDNNIEKEAKGIGGGNFRLETPREIDIKEGDVIVIPSLSLNLFGVVEKVEFKEKDSFQNVFFKNPINIQELKWVQVVLSNSKN